MSKQSKRIQFDDRKALERVIADLDGDTCTPDPKSDYPGCRGSSSPPEDMMTCSLCRTVWELKQHVAGRIEYGEPY